SSVYRQDGKFVHTRCFTRDITERRLAEEALRRNERQLRLITDALPTLVSYVDRDQCYRFVSETYERWFTRPRADIVGKHLLEVLGQPAYQAIRPHVERALAGELVRYEGEIPYPNAQPRYIEATYVPQTSDGGEPAGFVALITDVSERKWLERFRTAAATRAERLSRITAAIADAVSAPQVFEALVDRVYEAIEADSTGLWLVDEGGKTAGLVRALGYSEAATRHIEVLPLDTSPSIPILDAIRQGEPVWIRSQAELVERYPHLAGVVTPGRAYRICCLPLVAHGRVLGALGLTIESDSESEQEEREFLLLTARYASQAVERLRLFDAERRSRAAADSASVRMGILSRASRVFMTADLELEARVRDIVVELGPTLSSCVGISLIKPDELLHTVAVYHPSQEAQERLMELSKTAPLRLGEGITGSVAVSGQSVLIPQISPEEMARRAAPSYREFIERFPTYAMICAPLRARGEIIGTLTATRTLATETYTEEDLQLFEELAERAGAALDNARLYRSTLDAHNRAEQLYRFAQAVVVADTSKAVFEAALIAIEAALATKRAAVLTFDNEGVMRFVSWRNLSDAYRSAVEGHSPWPSDAKAPEPVLVADAKRDPALTSFAELLEREGIGALAFIPLVSRGQLLGKFMVYYDEPHTFLSHELETAVSIANHLASVMARFSVVARLEETLRANELFAGVLAHDLRNPLGAIQTATQVLLMRYAGRKLPGSDEAKPLSRILSSSARMARMIDQLLDFTRARTGGGIELSRRASDLGELCNDVLGEFELSHPEWKIECAMTGDLSGNWDADRLLQVLSNLVGNAGQHGDAGGLISVRLDGSHSDHVSLQIHNDGPVPESLVPQLFDPFRAPRQGRGRSGGLGLGLYIVRELVQAHGGSVEVSSSRALGTTFSVQLPRQAQRRSRS
ncbi:MAG TPA: GAF domain-containing protein, partial [Polyangiaceae bacterium]|nr:GAF domain-containing protein [Polyangiaceae bacterium]